MSEETNRETDLLANLGTPPSIIAMGEIERKMFSYIDDDDIDYLTYCSLGGYLLNNIVLRHLHDTFLLYKISVGGRGLKYAIKGESVRKGIGTTFNDEAPQHNRFSHALRTILKGTDWEEEERRRLNIE